MLIESLVLEGIGNFRDRLALGPLTPGLNILAQPNEWGKSTVVKALTRAFFDKYRSATEEIRQLRPAGSTLSPHVEVIFTTKGDRYRLVKGFLDRKKCELFRWSGADWERTDDSDRADQRLRALLGAPELEGRVAGPETWGFVRYLWARQDAPAEWPDWSGSSGDKTRDCLAAVDIDPTVRTLAKALDARAEGVFTARGKVKTGSPLDRAVTELERLRIELTLVREKRSALAELEQLYARLAAAIPVLEAEKAAKAAEALKSREQAEFAEKQAIQISADEAEFNRADALLLQLKRDQEDLTAIGNSEQLATGEAARSPETLESANAQLPRLEALVTQGQTELTAAKQRKAEAEKQLQRHRALVQWRQQSEELARLERQHGRVAEATAKVRPLEEQLAQLPRLTDAKLKKLRQADRDLRECRLRLEATGLRVTLTPDAATSVVHADEDGRGTTAIAAGESATLHSARRVELQLAGWGRIEIASGSSETAEIQARVTELSNALQMDLAALGVQSLASLETAADAARDLEQQIKASRAALVGHLGEWKSGTELEDAVTRLGTTVEKQIEILSVSPDERVISIVALQAMEEELSAKVKGAAQAEEATSDLLVSARENVEATRRQVGKETSALAALEAQLKGLAERRDSLRRRYPEGIDPLLESAQRDWVRAEARLLEARRKMPAGAEKLADRSVRAARAAAEVEVELARRSAEIHTIQVQLTERGGEGLYSKESELEERIALLEAEAARLREEGLAARLVSTLLLRRETEANRKVLGPLEKQLTEVFAGLTGIAARRVWFDESLQVRGVGSREDELIRFDDLSRGAREQMLLALRAAIALKLAENEPQCLVLDDVLVNTDPVRQENVIDYLQQLAGRVQIILLTCHAERYRGIGHHLVPVYPAP
jgi:hypothetical protein